MPASCILYTTDQTYLFPTLISAQQARLHAAADKADVIIFHFGLDGAAQRDFGAICAREGIGFIAVDPTSVEGGTPMMARLFLNRFVPSEYQHYLYLDGDVQITGSLDALIDADVPPGHFLAANDPMTFLIEDSGALSRGLRQHLRSIGLGTAASGRYFNTGVLRINRSGWDEIGQRAWRLVVKSAGGFRFPDQDPLNIAGARHRLPMSLAWNFPIFMRHARVEREINPSVWHFMSNPKPWQGAFPPWRPESCTPYVEALRRYPALQNYHFAAPFGRRVRYHVQQRYKKLTETVSWGFGERRRRILRYEEQVARR